MERPTTSWIWNGSIDPNLEVHDKDELNIYKLRAIMIKYALYIYIGPKREENGEWRRLHNEELHSLYRSPNIVRVIKGRL